MKKLLILMLVLAVAGIANALPIFTATSANPFEITINFADSTPASGLDVYIDYTPLETAGLTISDAVLTGSGASIANLYIYTVEVEGLDGYYLALGHTSNWTVNPTTLATLDLNGAAANVGSTSVTLNMYDGMAEPAGTVSVLIPEPATIALLCLGGLLIRKKK